MSDRKMPISFGPPRLSSRVERKGEGPTDWLVAPIPNIPSALDDAVQRTVEFLLSDCSATA